MLDTTESPLPITLPISASDRHQATTFANQQPNATKAEQVYRNTLAVLATQKYLQLLGIETSLEDSHSWNPLHQVLSNVADLVILIFPDVPKYLDCRPVEKGDRTCTIPESVWRPNPNHPEPDDIKVPHLMGHVLVQLDEPYQVAEILGFKKPVSTKDFSLKQLQPLPDLIDEFLEPEPVFDHSSISVPLHRWLDSRITEGWQQITQELKKQWSLFQYDMLVTAMEMRGGGPEDTMVPAMRMRSVKTPTPIPERIRQRIEALYSQEFGPSGEAVDHDGQSNQTDALLQIMQTTQSDETRWQAAELLWSVEPQHPQSPVITLKDLGIYLNKQTVALIVGLLPKEDGSFLILTRACPMAEAKALPSGLTLTGWDENNDPFFSVEARQRDQYVQFKFTAERGDRFSLKVTLDGHQFTESFMV
ncbi:MAG: DUF1822 family protein [Cyanobacteria bacterium P01_F01_bin.150]